VGINDGAGAGARGTCKCELLSGSLENFSWDLRVLSGFVGCEVGVIGCRKTYDTIVFSSALYMKRFRRLP
jgi:hypothetical protein